MTRVAIIAAMPGELKPLVRGWQRDFRPGVDLWRKQNGEDMWIAACAGAGVAAATRAFVEIEKEGPLDLVLSTGWAGALREGYAAGRAYGVSGVIDALTGERFRVSGRSKECWLVTDQRVADQAAKQHLAAVHSADLVDMEAAGIARLATARGIPFRCVKGVSDAVGDRLPDFNGFFSSSGKFQLGRFILFAALRPWHWRGLMRMGENSREAAQGIRTAVLGLLEDPPSLNKEYD
jgi:adenosylhomocysteine nucleosidase